MTLANRYMTPSAASFANIDAETDSNQKEVLMNDLFARFLQVLIKIKVLSYEELINDNKKMTLTKSREYFVRRMEEALKFHIGEKTMSGSDIRFLNFYPSLKLLEDSRNFRSHGNEWRGDYSIFEQQANRFENEMVRSFQLTLSFIVYHQKLMAVFNLSK